MEGRITLFALVAAIIMIVRKYMIEYVKLQESGKDTHLIRNFWKRFTFNIKYFFRKRK